MAAGRSAIHDLIGRIALVLMLAALGVRGLTPSGFMLDRDPSDGTVLVRMCAASATGGEPVHVRVALPNGETDDGQSAETAGCPYALASAPVVPVAPFAAPAPRFEPIVVAAPLARAPELQPLHGTPPPARGPPQTA